MSEAMFAIVLAFMFVALIALGISTNAERSAMRDAAIERGYAQYCPINGEWAWQGECDD